MDRHSGRARSTTRALTLVPVMLLAAVTVAAQPALERVVGPDQHGNPIVVEVIDAFLASRLSAAIKLPIGFEIVDDGTVNGRRRPPGPKLTGLTVLESLQTLTSFDSRYEWRVVDDIIVVRPAAAWNEDAHPLHQRIARHAPIRLERTRLELTVQLLRCLLGPCVDWPRFGNGDTVDFPLDLPAGSTLLNYLNAMARGHGEIAWTFGGCTLRVPGGPRDCGRNVTIWLQGSGEGIRLNEGAPPQAIDLSKFEYRPAGASAAAAAAGAAAAATELGASPSILGRVLPRNSIGLEGRVHAVSAMTIAQLSRAAGVPMGIEALAVGPYVPAGIDVNGRTLQETLNTLVAIDPRYEWRELNGVIVMRPVDAWTAGTGPLATRTPAIQFDGRLGTVLAVLRSLVGFPPQGESGPDSKTFRVDIPAGTLFDFLNATVLAHGEMTWSVEAADERHQAMGFRHQIGFNTFSGRGTSLAVPW